MLQRWRTLVKSEVIFVHSDWREWDGFGSASQGESSSSEMMFMAAKLRTVTGSGVVALLHVVFPWDHYVHLTNILVEHGPNQATICKAEATGMCLPSFAQE